MTRYPTTLAAGRRRHALPTRPPRMTPRVGLVIALGLVATLGLLLLFGRVVNEAVRQGELQRQAVAARAHAVWRCDGLLSRGQRNRCVAALDGTNSLPPPQQIAEGPQATSFDR